MTTICPTCGISVLEHPANRCLDSWVAEKVMRWERIKYFGCAPITDSWVGFWDGEWFRWIERPQSDDDEISKPWSPSTDIAAAWEVVEKLKALGFSILRLSTGDILGDWWQFHCADAYREITRKGDKDFFANAETPALAVCRTALLCFLSEQ